MCGVCCGRAASTDGVVTGVVGVRRRDSYGGPFFGTGQGLRCTGRTLDLHLVGPQLVGECCVVYAVGVVNTGGVSS